MVNTKNCPHAFQAHQGIHDVWIQIDYLLQLPTPKPMGYNLNRINWDVA